ncbi:MAG: acetolactate synthase large subunit [Candidatus Sumerlaeaceae bacterium]|nr:acetolactate synthase large subunit [Candidatus Sumerlaeaceae bacterium]
MKATGAQIITKLLERHGIAMIPGIPGGANLPLYDALRASSIRHILARHEQGGGFIAQGIARSTGRTAACLATSGPGATNLLTAIADAKLDSIPIVAITGQVPRAMIGTDAFQEIDTYGLTIPITKHNYLVRSAAELLEVIPDAFRIAASGRPGPVVVDVPKDVQNEIVEFDKWPDPCPVTTPPPPDRETLLAAARLVASARKPVILIGAGAVATEAGEMIIKLADKIEAPVASTLLGLGAIPSTHPRMLGMMGMHGAPCTNIIINEADLVIALGMRFDDRATGKADSFCPNAAIIHVDLDRSELGKIKQPVVALQADLQDFLRELLSLIDKQDRPGWRERVENLRSEFPLAMPDIDDPCQPYGCIVQTANLLDEAPIVVTDVGQHQMWVAQAFPFSFPRQFLTSGGLGTMGFGLPAAIGAALANPQKTVVCFSGDGSLQMNIQEMATAAELGVNVKVILMNNAHLGLVRQQQELFYGARFHASRFEHQPDFITIARGFGWNAYNLEDSLSPLDTLARALHEPGPVLVNVPIPQTVNVLPMVPPGAPNIQMIGGNYHVTQNA